MPEEYIGVVTEARAPQGPDDEDGEPRHRPRAARVPRPARGLIGFRSEFLTATRGTGLLHHVFDGYQPWAGEIKSRATASLVADRHGEATAYALDNLQERGMLFVGPGDEVYEGMLIGENAAPATST